MNTHRGFTLIELMVALAVVAIIAAIAYPAFTEAVNRGHRSEAIQALGDLALKQERYRSNSATYGTCDNLVTSCTTYNNGLTYYTVAVSVGTGSAAGTTYSLTATPKGAQTGDRCGTYTFAMSNGALNKSAASGQSKCL